MCFTVKNNRINENEKSLTNNILSKSNSTKFFELPKVVSQKKILNKSSLHFFNKKSNKNTIAKEILDPDKNLVKILDIDKTSNEIPFEFIEKYNNKYSIKEDDIIAKRNDLLTYWKLKESQKNKTGIAYEIKEALKRRAIQKLQTERREQYLIHEIKKEDRKLKEKKDQRNFLLEQMECDKNSIKLLDKEEEEMKDSHNQSIQDDKAKKKKKSYKVQMSKNFNESGMGNLYEIKKKELEQFQTRKKEITQERDKLKLDIKNAQLKIDNIDKNLRSYENRCFTSKNNLLVYYHKLLKEGIDSRQRGLSWIIESIWNMNEEVNMKYIPDFLDEKAISFLFGISQKNALLNKIKKYGKEFKLDNKVDKEDFSEITSLIQNTLNNSSLTLLSEPKSKESVDNILKNIMKLKGIKDKISANMIAAMTIEEEEFEEIKELNDKKKLRQYEMKKNEAFFKARSGSLVTYKQYIKSIHKEEKLKKLLSKERNSQSNFDTTLTSDKNNIEKGQFTLNMFINSNKPNHLNLYKIISGKYQTKKGVDVQKYTQKYTQLQLLENIIQKEIQIETTNELKRITQEFIHNDYGRRFNADIRIVINALVGEFHMIKEIERQRNILKQITEIKRECSFYDTLKDKSGKSILLLTKQKDFFS